MDLPVIYEDEEVLVIDKPTGIVVFDEKVSPSTGSGSLINMLISEKPELKSVGEAPRYGIVHRLDKDTSGVLLVAKTQKGLIFLQKQFKNREVEKKYLALVTGLVKQDSATIDAPIGRSPMDARKQKAYAKDGAVPESAREAITHYKVLERFDEYTLLEVSMGTGRKHQIRCHMAYIHHPVAGDLKYGFKDSPKPKELTRTFLHASYIKIVLPSGIAKEFTLPLPEDLIKVIQNLKIKNQN